ncbi:MAG: Riboflavin biosynthesis protein RibD [Candidatus Daviesbacteria bacterium GW2011_GWF2_38_7]|nr:MAG: Riboflavin biosynthesis protein RibD [Candidatus Daviesbacteria bacterium GW2011_GWF2_38_7]
MAISKNNLIRSKRINGEWMDMALNLAKKGKGKVPGRPLVGCVIVDKNNKKIGDGFFSKIGGHHAEIKALKRAGIKAKGATMYVTLEPHCFQGLTPPCTTAIIKANIKRIFIAIKDPFPNIQGRGIEELKGAGIKVEIGLKKKEANKLNQKWLLKNKN